MSTNINIDPTLWGSYGWRFMHYITLSYPDNPTPMDKNNMYNFFTIVAGLLPCEKCRYEFKENLKKYPLNDKVLDSRHHLVLWLLSIHNNVNKRLNKPLMSYEDFIKEYMKKNNKNVIEYFTNFNLDNSTLYTLLIIIIVTILLLLLHIRYTN